MRVSRSYIEKPRPRAGLFVLKDHCSDMKNVRAGISKAAQEAQIDKDVFTAAMRKMLSAKPTPTKTIKAKPRGQSRDESSRVSDRGPGAAPVASPSAGTPKKGRPTSR